VALTSLATLVLELTLTRLFSATMFYHFAFLAVSLALFGSGASGVALYVVRFRFPLPSRALALFAALFAVSTVAALLVVLANPIPPASPGLHTLPPLAAVYGAAALAFFFSGCTITLALTVWAGEASRLYSCDLVGAAAGCLLLVPALELLGAVDTVLLVAVLAGLAGVLFAGPDTGREVRIAVGVVAAGTAALLAWNHANNWIGFREVKGLPETGVLFSKWNSFSRVTVVGTGNADRRLILIDADAGTLLYRDAADSERHARQRNRIDSLAYHLDGREKVLVIGPGGGVDVIIARLFGAREVTAVEVNPLVARDVMSTEPFRGFSGRLYEQPGVRLVVDEARSFIRRSPEQYDLILGTMVDTWAATAAGAFALAENNLYTVEAFQDYLARLGAGGMLSMTRWYQNPPDQLLRLVSLGRAALLASGVADAAGHLILVRGLPEDGQPLATATFLLKKTPFADAEIERAEAFAGRLGFEVLYTPRTHPAGPITRLIEARDPQEFWSDFPSDVSPPRDDRPFFFQSVRLGRLLSPRWARGEWRKTNLGTVVLFTLVGISTVLVALFLLGPLLLVRARVEDQPGRAGALLYFACLGIGFIVIELAMVQKCVLFLGHPAYALTVVLFSVLVFSSLGSALSARIPPERLPSILLRLLPTVAALVVAYVLFLSPAFYGLVYLGAAWRVALTVSFLAPLGLLLGVPMPAGLRLLAAGAPGLVPWAWGVNGAASVLGSSSAVALAMLWGFDRTLLAGAGLYLVTWALVARGAVPASAPAETLGVSAATEQKTAVRRSLS
jgi:spermidine synthase